MRLTLTRSMGMLLLGIWLILTGLVQIASIPIPAIGTLLVQRGLNDMLV
jgi:hypothetical protein